MSEMPPAYEAGYEIGRAEARATWDQALDGVMDNPTPTKVRGLIDAQWRLVKTLEAERDEALRQLKGRSGGGSTSPTPPSP